MQFCFSSSNLRHVTVLSTNHKDGVIYLPEIKYRRILNRAFGPGGWGLVPRGSVRKPAFQPPNTQTFRATI
jgi:hypothetical protein